ncbi:protein SSUH2 homolog [Branchiostoma lanceolatum]|uniref:protein SSUH2 homolog n=1 Tax=Branchiostoma lanceolatum TaxID=7740 RepID=UPI0034539609
MEMTATQPRPPEDPAYPSSTVQPPSLPPGDPAYGNQSPADTSFGPAHPAGHVQPTSMPPGDPAYAPAGNQSPTSTSVGPIQPTSMPPGDPVYAPAGSQSPTATSVGPANIGQPQSFGTTDPVYPPSGGQSQPVPPPDPAYPPGTNQSQQVPPPDPAYPPGINQSQHVPPPDPAYPPGINQSRPAVPGDPVYPPGQQTYPQPPPGGPPAFAPGPGYAPPPMAMPASPVAEGQSPVQEAEMKSYQDVTEDEARELFAEFVSQQACWGSKPAEGFTFDSLTHSNAHHYTLETFSEKRWTEMTHTPFTGQCVDSREYGTPPDKWNVPQDPPALFQDDTRSVEMQHTASVRDCHNCDGSGKLNCPECESRGHVMCRRCDGTRVVAEGPNDQPCPCHECVGTGVVACSDCNGSGWGNCDCCQGHGQLKHYEQLNIEWKTHVSDHIVERSPLPDDLMKTVSGKQIFRDERFRVFPLANVDAEIIEHSNRLVQEHNTAHAGPDERIHMQRHTLTTKPVAEATYTWNGTAYTFYIYGSERRVFVPEYADTCCWGCAIL